MEEIRDGLGSMVAVAVFVVGDLGAVGGSDAVSFVYSSGGDIDSLSETMVNEDER